MRLGPEFKKMRDPGSGGGVTAVGEAELELSFNRLIA